MDKNKLNNDFREMMIVLQLLMLYMTMRCLKLEMKKVV